MLPREAGCVTVVSPPLDTAQYSNFRSEWRESFQDLVRARHIELTENMAHICITNVTIAVSYIYPPLFKDGFCHIILGETWGPGLPSGQWVIAHSPPISLNECPTLGVSSQAASENLSGDSARDSEETHSSQVYMSFEVVRSAMLDDRIADPQVDWGT